MWIELNTKYKELIDLTKTKFVCTKDHISCWEIQLVVSKMHHSSYYESKDLRDTDYQAIKNLLIRKEG